MLIGDLDEFRDIRLLRRDRSMTSVKKCEAASRDVMEIIPHRPCRNGTNALFRPAGAPACPVRRSCLCRRRRTRCCLSPRKRIHPRGGSAAEARCLPACLAKDLVTAGLGARCENRICSPTTLSGAGAVAGVTTNGVGMEVPCILFWHLPNGRPIHPSGPIGYPSSSGWTITQGSLNFRAVVGSS